MKRILLMVLRNLWFVPYGWFKLCYTAAHVEKYTEEERYQVLKMIDRRANIGGRITIDAYGKHPGAGWIYVFSEPSGAI